jgi:hypothetical protein
MTDFVTIAPLATHHLRPPRAKFLKLGIAAKFEAFSTGIGQAFSMAYVEPYNTPRHQPAIFRDVNLEGRDSNW